VSDIATDKALSGTASSAVKGFATIDHVSLINVEGTGMVGVPGIASAIFSTVR
jgi:aspartokinase/homoserine dehydrogenase 1